MLSEADLQVVLRDPKLPGLRRLLDPESTTAWVAQTLPHFDVRSTCVEYLRYKPETSCLAKLRIQTSAREFGAYAVVYRDAESAKCSSRSSLAVSNGDGLLVLSPFDRKMPSLARIESPAGLANLAARLSFDAHQAASLRLAELRHKPERRYVGKLWLKDVPLGTLRLYSGATYAGARRAFRHLRRGVPELRYQGASDRHRAIAVGWVEGEAITADASEDRLASTAGRLAALHMTGRAKLQELCPDDWGRRMQRAVTSLGTVAPDLASSMRTISERLGESLSEQPCQQVTLHGDAHPEQFLYNTSSGKTLLIDFDHACLGPPEWDLANLAASLLVNQRAEAIDSLVDAYGRPIDRRLLEELTALRLTELAVEPFRTRVADWHERSRQIVSLAHETLQSTKPTRRPEQGTPSELVAKEVGLPAVRHATDTEAVTAALSRLASFDESHRGVEVDSIRLLRHKHGRRCLIEYQGRSLTTNEPITLLGKLEAKPRSGRRLRTQRLLWENGFNDCSPDGVRVAKPWGEFSPWRMWLQHRVDGVEAAQLLKGNDADRVVQRMAIAIAKLHSTDLPIKKTYTPQDEAILIEDRLRRAAEASPAHSRRLSELRARSLDLIGGLSSEPTTSIHRDYHPGQAILDGDQIVLLDLDLLCRGDPAIDVGNFLGCLQDFAIRMGWPDSRCSRLESVFVKSYSRQLDSGFQARMQAYAALTVSRHAWIALQHPSRQRFFESILTAAELRTAECQTVSTRP